MLHVPFLPAPITIMSIVATNTVYVHIATELGFDFGHSLAEAVNSIALCEIWVSHGGPGEDSRTLRQKALYICSYVLRFRQDVLS